MKTLEKQALEMLMQLVKEFPELVINGNFEYGPMVERFATLTFEKKELWGQLQVIAFSTVADGSRQDDDQERDGTVLCARSESEY